MGPWRPIRPGTILGGRYEVETLLGRGGFGATYRAADRERFGQTCALKELLPTQAGNPKVRELFEREARTLLALRHAGIPALHAYFSETDRHYLVQDFVPGTTLAEELEQRGRLSEAAVLQIVEDGLEILEYLHGRRPPVIHRDLKPANLIRADSGRLYVVDFGAVKEALGHSALQAESTIIGTAGYTPPEQLRGLVTPASDLYALGATALHLVSGRPPAEWYDAAEGSWRFQGNLDVSGRLERLFLGLLEEQVGQRFQSATDVRRALRDGSSAPTAATERVGVSTRRPAKTTEETGHAGARRDAPATGGASSRALGWPDAQKQLAWYKAYFSTPLGVMWIVILLGLLVLALYFGQQTP